MKRIYIHICISILLIFAASCLSDVRPTETIKYIIVFHEKGSAGSRKNIQNVSREERIQEVYFYAQRVLKEYGFSNIVPIEVYESVYWGFTAKLSSSQASILENDKRIRFVEKDVTHAYSSLLQKKPITNPPSKDPLEKGTKEKGSMATQTKPWGVQFIGGGATYGGANAVWIVDTGIDLSHPDLNVFAQLGFNALNPKDSPNDDNGHGTHVAGIVGAKDNAFGVVGVAANAPVVPIKVLGSSGSGTVSDIIEGIDHIVAFAKQGDVVNMSLGGEGVLSLDEAVLMASQRGLYFAIAAGNESANSGNYSPARVNSNNIWTVSAHDANGALASFSNYGNPPVDVSAPGVKINSTFRGGKYNTQNGTSMAAPHVAGVLLLTNGRPTFSGTIKNDRDNQPDPMLLLQNQ